ncbi:MAG: PAS domain S-box protein [Phycisphaerales bacterium]|nr:PAS domain S-box protein [Phycisphaerales bacterium]MCB9856353.1 PAS domain S-box protein [Phycisphaerales bacterium]MCB9864025.1 PAS domain S-box protein [Phycisphaerales bacterium]
MAAIESDLSNAVLRSVIDALAVPVAVVGDTQRIELVSDAWRRLGKMAGFDPDSVAEGNDVLPICVALGLIREDAAPRCAQALNEILAGRRDCIELPASPTGSPEDASILRITRISHAGTSLALVTLINPIRTTDSDAGAQTGPAEGISDRNTTLESLNQSLRESEWRLSEAQRIAHVGNWDRDLRTGQSRWSDEVYRILGVDPDKASPTLDTFIQCMHPEDRDRVGAGIRESLQRGENINVVVRIIRPDGQVRYVRDTGEFTFDASGDPTRVFGVLQDITDEKRAESHLRDQSAAHSIRARLRDADRSHSEPDAWHMLVGAIVEEFEFEGGLFAALSEDRIRLICTQGHIDRVPETLDIGPLPFAESDESRALRAAILHVKPFRSEDLTGHLQSHRLPKGPSRPDYRSYLAVPVEVDGRVIGGVMFQAGVSSAFSRERVRHIEELVNEWGERILRLRIEREVADSVRHSERRLLHVIAEMPVLMIAIDEDGKVIAWNSECERTTGFPASEIIGNPDAISRLYPDETRRTAFLDHWISGDRDFRDWELETSCRDGGSRTIAWSRVSDRFAIAGWAHWGIGIDTTDRRKAETALAKSEREYRGLFDNAHDAIIIFRPDDEVVLEANPHACKLYGLSRDEFIGMSLLDISKDPERGKRRIAETMQLGKNAGFETIQYRKDGEPMRLEINATVIDYRGERAILTINRDITSRRNAEDNLRSSEARYRWLADHSTDIILRISIDGTILDASHASRAVLGCPPDELVGVNCCDLVTPKFRDPLNATIRKATQKPGTHRIALQFHRMDRGDRWLECLIEGLRNTEESEVREIVAVARDMSLRKQEEELRELRFMELSHVNRLVTLGEMAGQIAHQLHQPLTAISNYAGTMRNLIRKTGDGAALELEPYCDEIVRSAIRTGEFIHRIRTFTQRRGLRRSNVQLGAVVSNAFSLCEIRLQRMGVHTSYCEATDLPEIVVDTIQIEQVLVNLINNAIDAMSTRDPGQRRLSVTAHVESATQMLICVRDSGVGLPDDGQKRLFQPFHTTKPDGVGMGLVISRRIVEAHGGKLWLESQPNGSGTAVYFTLSVGENNDDDD